MQPRWLALSLTLLGCGEEPHPAPSLEDVPELAAALEATSQSVALLCATTDRCYPELTAMDPAGNCFIGNAEFAMGFERAWPPQAADSCWVPLFEKYPAEILDHLTCLQDAHEASEACLNSCPVSTQELVACDNVVGAGPRSCLIALMQQGVDQRDMNAYGDCEARLAPKPE